MSPTKVRRCVLYARISLRTDESVSIARQLEAGEAYARARKTCLACSTCDLCLRWLDGWFYDFYLEAHDGYELRVVRSRDLESS